MKNINYQTVGEIVVEDYRTAAIFQTYNIDFCCRGNRTLVEVCEQKKINLEDLLNELDEVRKMVLNENNSYDIWSLDLLIDHIELKHHNYIKEKIPILTNYLDKLCEVHGGKHPELFQIGSLWHTSKDLLIKGINKEELILFPFVKKLVLAGTLRGKMKQPIYGDVSNTILTLKEEHQAEIDRFFLIKQLSNNYIPPNDACNTYRIAFRLLEEFENDLNLHIHLENNILFPKTLALYHQQFIN